MRGHGRHHGGHHGRHHGRHHGGHNILPLVGLGIGSALAGAAIAGAATPYYAPQSQWCWYPQHGGYYACGY
jgi:hypothetical protein